MYLVLRLYCMILDHWKAACFLMLLVLCAAAAYSLMDSSGHSPYVFLACLALLSLGGGAIAGIYMLHPGKGAIQKILLFFSAFAPISLAGVAYSTYLRMPESGSLYKYPFAAFLIAFPAGFLVSWAIAVKRMRAADESCGRTVWPVEKPAALSGSPGRKGRQERASYAEARSTAAFKSFSRPDFRDAEGREYSCGLGLVFDPVALARMQSYAILALPDEISGFGKVRLEGGVLICTEIRIHCQSNMPGHSALSRGGAIFLDELVQRGEDPREWRLWWHSHGAGAPFWSSEDQGTVEGYCVKNDESICHWLVSVVLNSRGEMLARFDQYWPVRFTVNKLPHSIHVDPKGAIARQCRADMGRYVGKDEEPLEDDGGDDTHLKEIEEGLREGFGEGEMKEIWESDDDVMKQVEGERRLDGGAGERGSPGVHKADGDSGPV